jgi:hypothetical protein
MSAEDALKRLWRLRKSAVLAVLWLYASVGLAWATVSWVGYALSGQLGDDALREVGGAATAIVAAWLASKRALTAVRWFSAPSGNGTATDRHGPRAAPHARSRVGRRQSPQRGDTTPY